MGQVVILAPLRGSRQEEADKPSPHTTTPVPAASFISKTFSFHPVLQNNSGELGASNSPGKIITIKLFSTPSTARGRGNLLNLVRNILQPPMRSRNYQKRDVHIDHLTWRSSCRGWPTPLLNNKVDPPALSVLVEKITDYLITRTDTDRGYRRQ